MDGHFALEALDSKTFAPGIAGRHVAVQELVALQRADSGTTRALFGQVLGRRTQDLISGLLRALHSVIGVRARECVDGARNGEHNRDRSKLRFEAGDPALPLTTPLVV